MPMQKLSMILGEPHSFEHIECYLKESLELTESQK